MRVSRDEGLYTSIKTFVIHYFSIGICMDYILYRYNTRICETYNLRYFLCSLIQELKGSIITCKLFSFDFFLFPGVSLMA